MGCLFFFYHIHHCLPYIKKIPPEFSRKQHSAKIIDERGSSCWCFWEPSHTESEESVQQFHQPWFLYSYFRFSSDFDIATEVTSLWRDCKDKGLPTTQQTNEWMNVFSISKMKTNKTKTAPLGEIHSEDPKCRNACSCGWRVHDVVLSHWHGVQSPKETWLYQWRGSAFRKV